MKLTSGEATSQLWDKLKTHCDDRLSKARTRLESNIGHEDSISLRAQIKELKNFLELAQPARKTEAD